MSRRQLGLLLLAFVLASHAWYFVGYHVGKEHGCDRVGSSLGVFRTDSHVYRVCR